MVRASAIGELSATDLDAMRSHGIRCVIDIRSPDEIVERASPYAAGATHVNAHFALGRTMQIDQAALAGTMAAELARLAGRASGLADVIQAIARAEPGVIVHCVAGRDRTGFIVAVVLSAIGVHDDDIIADYVASDVELESEYRRYIAEHADDEANVWAAITRRAATMRSVLAAVRTGYGDAIGYLRAAGVAEVDIDRLRAKLVA